jgi:hypothetical protein
MYHTCTRIIRAYIMRIHVYNAYIGSERLLLKASGRQVFAYISYVHTYIIRTLRYHTCTLIIRVYIIRIHVYNTCIAAERNWATEVVAMKEQVMWLLTSDLLAANVPPIVGSRDATAVFLLPHTLPLNIRNKNSHK